MPKLGLPPLPHPRTWSTYFPRKIYSHSATVGVGEREYSLRYALTNPRLLDQFVRAMRLRKDEVIIEAFPGIGSLTRSLLTGGQGDLKAEDEARKAWWEEKKEFAPDSSRTKTPKVANIYPNWIETFGPEKAETETKEELSVEAPTETKEELSVEAPTEAVVKPKLVVAIDPSRELLRRGFGVEPTEVDTITNSLRYATYDKLEDIEPGQGAIEVPCQDRLIVSRADPYTWETLPFTLRHPLINKHLPRLDPSAPPTYESSFRKWTDPEPHMTMVACVPTGVVGDQLLNQWVSSIVGAAEGKPQFIWRHGRLRLAVLCSKNAYDKLMAKPGETALSKVTIVARALYDITPLPPYHHVPNVDKSSRATEALYWRKNQMTPVGQATAASYTTQDLERTTTYPEDFYPPEWNKQSNKGSDTPLKRPTMLGLMLTPKKESLYTHSQRDEWDYVLRHIFVLQSRSLEAALPTLGFNGVSLKAKIEDPSDTYAGRPVDCSMPVRDLDVEDWARVVDVFANWPFRPESLLLDRHFGLGDDFDPSAPT